MFCQQMSRTRHSTSDEAHFLIRTLRSAGSDSQTIAPHAHPWPQLLAPLRGVLTVWTEVGSWIVPPGSALWAPAGIQHGVRFSGRVEMQSLYFRPDSPHSVLPDKTGVIAVSPLLRELIGRSVDIGVLDARITTHCAIATLIADALSERNTPAFELPMPRSPDLLRLVVLAHQAPRAPAALANAAGMSLRTLERRFSDETGLPIGRWLRQSRLIESLRDLASGTSVKAVAHRAGYSTPSAFVTAFRGLFRTTPGQFFGTHRRDTETFRVQRSHT